MKVLLFIVCNLFYCLSVVHAQSYEYMYKSQRVNDSVINNRAAHNRSKNGYTDSTDTSKVIGFAITPLYKKQPESPLGNLMADCMKLYAEKLYNKKVDAAFVNFSSMHSYIPKGDVSIGTIFSVMPYDNKIVLLAIQGNVLKQFLDHQASLGGWPCAGISMAIKDMQAVDIQIDSLPLDETKTYIIAVSDYIANGGNQCTMLKGLQQLDKGFLFRTALIDYVTSFTLSGKPITATIQNRVVYIK
jgi:2',3'-cyclic-nucleotide 2'-phosphodiesterase (5'-nucleotidase family)